MKRDKLILKVSTRSELSYTKVVHFMYWKWDCFVWSLPSILTFNFPFRYKHKTTNTHTNTINFSQDWYQFQSASAFIYAITLPALSLSVWNWNSVFCCICNAIYPWFSCLQIFLHCKIRSFAYIIWYIN